jgi:putative glycosyltransferase (TIGR04348 family)
MLRDRYRVIVQTEWSGEACDALIALHARRSAGSVALFRERAPARRMAVVLTGTDLYRDFPESAEVARSLDSADRIVVLQDEAPHLLTAPWRRKCEVIFQSARLLAPRRKPTERLSCVVVGHLREEKDPRTLFRALERIPDRLPIHVLHIGAPLDPGLGQAARAMEQRDSRYRYAGPLPRGLARAAIGAAHVLIHPSIVEGGANVIVEAVTAGTAVIASRIPGNVGMLGRGHPGYFEAGDASGLARRLVQACEDRAYRRELFASSNRRRPLFSPAKETRAIRRLVGFLLS